MRIGHLVCREMVYWQIRWATAGYDVLEWPIRALGPVRRRQFLTELNRVSVGIVAKAMISLAEQTQIA